MVNVLLDFEKQKFNSYFLIEKKVRLHSVAVLSSTQLQNLETNLLKCILNLRATSTIFWNMAG